MRQGAMLTVLSGLLTALAWPAALLSATDWIDSIWSIAIDRFNFILVLIGIELLQSKGKSSTCLLLM
jgi:predicted tellurium resistance membrane protein TerC